MKTEHDFAPRRSIRSSATGFISAGLSRPHIGQFVLPVAVFGLILSFALASPYFWDDANFRNIARQGAGLAAVALGQTFVVLIAGLDLSVGATAGLVSVVAAWGAVNYTSFTGVLLALGTGAAIGLVNGLVVARLRVAPFVATLAMLSVASGLALIISGGIPISGLPRGFRTFATTDVLGIPAAALVSLGLFVLGYVILRWLRTGRHFYAVGGNKEAARLAGIPVVRVQVSAYVLCSIFTAVGALILTARVNSGQPNLGGDLTLQSIAAVVLGGVSLFGGRGSIVGVVFGIAFISILANGMNLLNIQSNVQLLVIGAALVLAVALDSYWARRMGISNWSD